MPRKYTVTMNESITHTFEIEVEDDEDPREVAEEVFVQACSFSNLPEYKCIVAAREVEHVQPE